MSKKRTYREWAQKEKERNERLYKELEGRWYCPIKKCNSRQENNDNPYYIKIGHTKDRNSFNKKQDKRYCRRNKYFLPSKGNLHKKVYAGKVV